MIAVVSTVSWFRVSHALEDSETARGDAVASRKTADERLWEALVAEVRAIRMSGQPGQHSHAVRAIKEALKLPLPAGRSRDELRNEAIAAFCLPELEVDCEWDGCPAGTTSTALDRTFARYARGDEQGNVTLRRVSDDAEILRLKVEGTVTGYDGLRFSPDGGFLHVTYMIGGRLAGRCWDLRGPVPVSALDHDSAGFAFEPEGRQCAAAFADGSVRIVDLATGAERRSVPSATAGIEIWLEWSPRTSKLAILSRERAVLRILDIDSGAVSLLKADDFQQGCWFDCIDWHPEGRWIAVSVGRTRQILVLDAASGDVVRTLEGHRSWGILVRFNHRGDRLVSNDWSGLLRLWDVNSGHQLLALPAGGTSLQFSPDDQQLGLSAEAPKARILRCRAGSEFRTLVHRGRRPGFEFHRYMQCSRNGRLLAASSDSGLVLIDLNSNCEICTIPEEIDPIGFDSEDRALWTKGAGGLRRWPIEELSMQPMRWRVGTPEVVSPIVSQHGWGFSSDRSVIAAALFTAGAFVLDRSTGKQHHLGPQRDVRYCAVSPDGEWVATGSHDAGADPGARVWNSRTGEIAVSLPVPGLCQVGFSPDGRWLLTTGGQPRLWHVGTWEAGSTFPGRWNSSFAFSEDGRILALSDETRGALRMIDPETGREIALLASPESSWLMPMCFTAAGESLIACGSESRAIHTFDLRALRGHLAGLNLDWNAPPLPPPAASQDSESLEIVVDLGGDAKE